MKNNSNQSGFYLLSDNTDAFVARFALATLAEKTLDIQYYLMHNDASGEYLGYAILAAADRGVHVRILVDDINLSGRDSRLKMLSQHSNIEIRIFNPLANRQWFRNIELIINLNRAGRRMHNKTFIADSSSAIIGGRNIGDEYFDARHSLNFVDLDLLSIGPIVNEITVSFDAYWNSQWATAIEDLSKIKVVRKQLSGIRRKLKDKWRHAKNSEYFHSLQLSDFTKKLINKQIPFIWANAELLYDRPEKMTKDKAEKHTHFAAQLFSYVEQASKELLITSPYFVPGNKGVKIFKNKLKQGMSISILTNSLAATDVIAAHAGYKKYRKQLAESGITLFELKTTAQHFLSKTKQFIKGSSNASLHAKYMVIDEQYVFIGSANLDPRSQLLNTEIGIIVNSKELARLTRQLFMQATSASNSYQLAINNKNKQLCWKTEEHGKQIQYANEPKASLLKKLGVYILGLLPIESLL